MTGTKSKTKKVAIALQGGGSWGAFSWGVLDRLLAEPDIEITDICGTSAGALNGSIVSYAMNSANSYEEGAKQAREDLRRFWNKVADQNHELMSLLSVLQGGNPFAAFRDPVRDPNLPALTWMQHSKTFMEANPFMRFSGLTATFNRAVEGTATMKLRRIIREFIPSYDVIREGKRLKLHVNGAEFNADGFKNRNFSGKDLSIDAAMASATLKGLFEPVEIDGKFYFDGAYSQNPPTGALSDQPKKTRKFDDIIWVMANPPKGKITPRKQDDIPAQELAESAELVLHHAYDELAYNVAHEKKSDARSHLIFFKSPHHYNQTSKQNTEAAFLKYLYEEGVQAAENFIKAHKKDLGKRSSVDMKAVAREARTRKQDTLWPKP
jgi:NTE family protein